MFRSKIGNSQKLQGLFGGKGVPDFYGAVVVNADNIAWIGFFNIASLLGQKKGGVGYFNIFTVFAKYFFFICWTIS